MPYKTPKPAPKKPAKGGGKAASGSNLYTPVKQSTIDKIKSAGMAASLKKAATSKDMEFVQGVRRMYGANRLAAAKKAAGSVAKSPDAARAAAMKKPMAKPVAKSADAARASYTKSKSGMPGAGPSARMATKAAAKKSTSAKPDWRKTGIGPVVAKNIKSGNWRKKGLLG